MDWYGIEFSQLFVKVDFMDPLPNTRQILDSSKLKEFANNNFKLMKTEKKFFKRVENTVGKGEIARYKQFLLFRVFSKGMFPRGVKRCHCVGIG